MKSKILTCLFVALFSVAFVLANVPGDLTGDGYVDPLDIPLMKGLIASGEYDPIADVNGNGVIDEADLNRVKEGVAGEEPNIIIKDETESETEDAGSEDACSEVKGDLTCDGAVDPLDLPLAKGFIARGEYNVILDIDDNGILDECDFSYIKDVITGKTQPIIVEKVVAPTVTSTPTSSGGSRTCKPRWDCSEWSNCESTGKVIKEGEAEEGIMKRTCESTNRCIRQKPETEKSCIYYITQEEIKNFNVEGETETEFGVVGASVLNIEKGNPLYWLLALGIVVVITSSVLYLRQVNLRKLSNSF